MKTFEHEFNPDQHLISAKKQLKLQGISNPTDDQIQILGLELKASWAAKGKAATDHGTSMHSAIQHYLETTEILPEHIHNENAIRAIGLLFSDYKSIYCEQLLWFKTGNIRICGTSDAVCLTKNRAGQVDYFDFKTSKSNQIDYYDKYKKFFLPPVNHLEHCKYSKYVLQLSTYAFMGEVTLGLKPGRLQIILIPNDDPMLSYSIPVPYLKYEVIEMFRCYIKINQ